jgi:hypothetical protein
MQLLKQDYRFGAVDLSQAEPGTLKAGIHIAGLDGEESEAMFTEAFWGFHEVSEPKDRDAQETHDCVFAR